MSVNFLFLKSEVKQLALHFQWFSLINKLSHSKQRKSTYTHKIIAPKRPISRFRRQKNSDWVFKSSIFAASRLTGAYLRGHDPLPLSDQLAFGTLAFTPVTETFVAFQRRHISVISAPGTFRHPRRFWGLGRRQRSAAVRDLLALPVLAHGCWQ